MVEHSVLHKLCEAACMLQDNTGAQKVQTIVLQPNRKSAMPHSVTKLQNLTEAAVNKTSHGTCRQFNENLALKTASHMIEASTPAFIALV